MPLGTGTEIFTFDALDAPWRDGHEPHHREHVDEYVYEHPERFQIERVDAAPELRRPDLRLTVDTAEDLALITDLQRLLGPDRGCRSERWSLCSTSAPDLASANRHVVQKRR